MKQGLFFAFFSLIQCVCSFGMQMDVVRVGPANCTVFKTNDRALICDCGYSAGNWMSSGRFTYEKWVLFTNIMGCIEEVGIVISHDDTDHKNLLPALRNFLGDRIKFIINIKDQNALPIEDLCNLQTFFGEFYVFPIIPDFREDSGTITTNDKSLILKIAVVSGEQGYSFLMTGDATRKTLAKIIDKKIITWDNPTLGDKTQYWTRCLDNLFVDIISFMPAHHGTDTEGSLEWSRYVLSRSSFPVLTIISSDPSVRNQSPTLRTIFSLNEAITSNLRKTAATNNYFCVPHDIDCYYEAFTIKDDSLKFTEDSSLQVIRYPSFYAGFIVPMFVTSNSQSGIYTVSLNPDLSVTLFDNTLQLYGCNTQGVDHELLSAVCTAYMHYHAIKRLQETEQLLGLLQDGVFAEIEGNLDAFIVQKPTVIKNTKILSYLSQVIPLLCTVIEQTSECFAAMQNGDEFLDIVAPQTSPKDILFTLFKHYSKTGTNLPSSMFITAAINVLRRQYSETNDGNFTQFLESIGVAEEEGAFREFLCSVMAAKS